MKMTPIAKAQLEAAGHQAALLYIDELAIRKAAVGHIESYVFRYFDLPYVIIPVEARNRYLNALEAANHGSLWSLTDLIIEQYEHSLDQLLSEELSSES